MTAQEPVSNYVYQPYPAGLHGRGDNLYGVNGPDVGIAIIRGLTRVQAQAIADALNRLHGRPEVKP